MIKKLGTYTWFNCAMTVATKAAHFNSTEIFSYQTLKNVQ